MLPMTRQRRMYLWLTLIFVAFLALALLLFDWYVQGVRG
jgi:hypothetical protein